MELYKNIVEWHLPLGHEKELLDYMKSKLSENSPGAFVDIGANVGTWILHLSNRFQHCFAFEPLDKVRTALEANLRLNNITNTSVIPTALSDSIAIENLTYYETGGHATLLPYHPIGGSQVGKRAGAVPVQTTTLDSCFCLYEEDLSLIKIDTEGYEPQIIKGGLHTIKTYKPALVIEIHDQTHNQIIRDLLPERDFEEFKYCEQVYLISWGK